MNRCLLCHEPLIPTLRFQSLLSPDEPAGFCDSCRQGLIKIDRKKCCAICGRDLTIVAPSFISQGVCFDCKRWEESGMSGVLQRNYSVYQYNERMKMLMTAFKFRGDAVLAQGFKPDFQAAYNQIRRDLKKAEKRRERTGRMHAQSQKMTRLMNQVKWPVDGRLQAAREKLKASVRFPDFTAFSLYRNKANEDLTIVPVPLSGERLLERSYNQSRLLAELLGNKVTDALIRRVNEPKQSKKGRRERLEMKENPFRLVDSCRKQLAGRQVLLIDDIYTTGATLRLAAQALQPAGPKSIVSLTLAHG